MCIYKCQVTCKVNFKQFQAWLCFKHILAYYSRAYSSIFRTFVYPWNIQTTRCIRNTILNIFTRAPSWMFDTVLNAPILSILSNFQSDFTATLCFRHIQACSRFIQSYSVLLRHTKRALAYIGTFCFSNTQKCSKGYI